MAFEHPRRPGVRVDVTAALPADLRAVLDALPEGASSID
jgi:hypothetical protein